MAETSQVAYANHEYAISRGDRFLGLIKAVVRDAEKRHDSLALLARFAKWIPGHGPVSDPSLNRVITFGDRSNSLYLSSPFILAAGANKTGNQIPEFAHLGFGGLCVGTATRQARPGNQHHPRTELIPEDRAIQNSMGLNNPGVDSVAKAVDQSLGKAHRNGMCVGLSVAETPGVEEEEQQVEDVLDSFRKAYRVADWVEVNVSCPNTGHGRGDADTTHVEHVFQAIMRQRRSQPLRKAVYAKLSPDMGERQLLATLEVLRDLEVSGVVLFNTFPSERCKFLGMKTPMENMRTLTDQGGKGGISGRPLYINTFRAVEFIKQKYPGFSVIASGGVDHGRKAYDLIRLGADAVECYSVLAYRWAAMWAMRKELLAALREDGWADLQHFYEKRQTGSFRRLS